MWKSGTFDLADINETLIDEIVFFDISYSGMGESGCVIFFTKSGDEYIITQLGTEWRIDEIVKLFPDMYEVYRNQEKGIKDEYGFTVIGNWKILPKFAGLFLIKLEYFDKFYAVYQTENDLNKKFPCCTARLLFGKERFPQPDTRMVYIKTQKCWDQDMKKEIAIKKETEKNRLSDTDVPWMKYKNIIWEGYIKFWVRKNDDGTLSGFRWLIQVQREQSGEISYKLDAPIECYNLFLEKYEKMDAKLINDFEKFYFTYVNCHEAGKFVRSYKNLEKAKEAVSIRNEWCGWGNVNKKNVYMIDYEYLKTRIEGDSQICIF